MWLLGVDSDNFTFYVYIQSILIFALQKVKCDKYVLNMKYKFWFLLQNLSENFEKHFWTWSISFDFLYKICPKIFSF